jgi:hypothetical protein
LGGIFFTGIKILVIVSTAHRRLVILRRGLTSQFTFLLLFLPHLV